MDRLDGSEWGVGARAGDRNDLVETGIVQPMKVVRTAMQKAR